MNSYFDKAQVGIMTAESLRELRDGHTLDLDIPTDMAGVEGCRIV